MGTYTTADYIKEIERRKKSFDKAKLIFPCASTAHDSQIQRMREREQNADNKPLVSKYSTKPMYMSAQTSAPKTFKPIGKTGKTEFKASGKPHKTIYFPGGYKQFKETIKRPMFEVFGRMFSDFQNSLQRQGEYYITGLKDKFNGKKAKGLIERFGKASFELTKEEKIQYNNCINNKLMQILQGNA